MNEDVILKLFEKRDEKFKEFNSSLIPSIEPCVIIGVKTAPIKALAKEMYKSGNYSEFLEGLPHTYFEENQLHAFIIAEMKSFDKCIVNITKFLPYIDNWATCDQLSPKVFSENKEKLTVFIEEWIKSEHPYTIRFAVNMLMKHFLDDTYRISTSDMVADIVSEEYYVNMVRAWYFATALAKQWSNVLPYLVEYRLDAWTHNKTIQKAVESLRISNEQKEYLKTLKIKTS